MKHNYIEALIQEVIAELPGQVQKVAGRCNFCYDDLKKDCFASYRLMSPDHPHLISLYPSLLTLSREEQKTTIRHEIAHACNHSNGANNIALAEKKADKLAQLWKKQGKGRKK